MEKRFGQRKSKRKSLDKLGIRNYESLHLNHFLIILLLFVFVYQYSFSQKIQNENGDFVRLDLRNSIVVFFDPECPICEKYTKNLKELKVKYAEHGIKLFIIYPFRILPQQSLADFKKEYDFDEEIYFDKKRKLMKKLRATTSPEFFLIDKNKTIIYQGAMDNWFYGLGKNRPKPTEFYLLDALENYLSKKEISKKYVEPIGCKL